MPLSIRYVRSLDDVVAPAKDFLCRSVDFFARQRIVVPTAGAKAWLAAKLAEQLGASRGGDGKPMGDGIVANVEFSYPGPISSLLSDAPRPEIDPWDVDRLTFTILEVLDENKEAFKSVVVRAGGPLLAARRIADRFDHYHFRRPGMILQWEVGHATLSPSADAEGVEKTPAIAAADQWQFDLWRAVRDKIGEPSPPAREREATGPAPDAVMVAGLQGLSLHQLAILERLASMPSASGDSCDVQVWLVHPSPPLREKWAEVPEAPPRSPGLAPLREEPEPSNDVDPLVDSWLRGTREMQWLLRSQGHEPVHDSALAAEFPAADATLLERLQHTVAFGHVATPADSETTPDDSIRIHRCHDLGRQAEVLHDAILHAFREIEGLAPHDVVIVSPQIAKLAPHLEAVFDRHVNGKAADGTSTGPIDLPLIVADRGIREVSRGAELLAAIIELIGSRYSVDDMLRVAAHPLVLEHFGLGEDDVEDWYRCIERTKIRWGLDGPRRTSLDRSDLMAHTWRLGLERALLGAVIPDGIPEPVLGGVVPLAHVEPAELTSLAPLISIFTIIDDLDRQARESHPVGAWCDILEAALETLAGEENDELLVPIRELSAVRQAAATAKTESSEAVCVPFHDVKTILAGKLTAPVGRQPLRTGAITATSMIPLRGVPFRVVCVAGFDDDAVAPRERDGEDLVDRQDLLGDGDPRLDVRRGLLDCVLAAQDRLIITCTGMDVKNNATLPLATPLAELTDFVDRHGVMRFPREGEKHCGIEVFHPRHACSRKNFVVGDTGVVQGEAAWSHDAAALAAAVGLGQELDRNTDGAPVPEAGIAVPTHIDLKELAEFMHDPLWPYVTKTLEIKRWRDTDLSTPATIPLELEKLDRRNLRDDYIKDLLAADNPDDFTTAWVNAVKVNADVPILGFGDGAIVEITLFTESLFELAREKKVPLGAGREIRIDLTLGDVHLSGKIEDWYPDEGAIVLVRPDAKSSKDFHKPRMLAAVLLLAARAEGHDVTEVIEFNQHEKWPLVPDQNPAQARTVKAPEGLTPEVARTHLARLCGLYQQAAIRPYGCFGDASARLDEPESARKKFLDFVSNDRYSMSNESLVYGPQPDFDLVFPEDESVRGFFQSLQGLTTFTRSHAYIPT
jgi:exodeoxyribonuclease V gamma subunit